MGCGQLLSPALPEKYRQLEGRGQSHECYFILMKDNFIIDLRISKITLMPKKFGIHMQSIHDTLIVTTQCFVHL